MLWFQKILETSLQKVPGYPSLTLSTISLLQEYLQATVSDKWGRRIGATPEIRNINSTLGEGPLPSELSIAGSLASQQDMGSLKTSSSRETPTVWTPPMSTLSRGSGSYLLHSNEEIWV
ncbi:hypothetical protein RB195_014547 [Necator americanus]|uniref:Uncharacterized protein n=1 Tax=Necator americanus TaxID=51031 RepID=A0ABR1E2B7_NECAM